MLTNQLSFSYSPQSVWKNCLSLIEEKVGTSCFETWFRTTELDVTTAGCPCIKVPNSFFADFMEEHYSSLIAEVLTTYGIDPIGLKFDTVEKDWEILEPITQEITKTRERTIPSKAESISQFHPNYTFDKFVVGHSNRMAHAAALAVAEAPGKTSFNPLFIYGGTGLGKTHILQAIGHFAQTEGTVDRVVYMTSQEFTTQYINYVTEKKDSTSFYSHFNDADLLLIDDIHFLSGKPGTQKEFYRIFNRLLLQHKQIVLSSDRPPDKIPDMMDHIINRFMGGLVTDIQPPNLETRMAIIKKKAEIDHIHLPDDVVQYVASNITSNVRELEGTLVKLIASSSFTGKGISLEVAREIFGDVISRQDQRLTVDTIKKSVADFFSISPNQLSAHTRRRDISHPRSIAMYLAKKWTKQSLRTIGLDFGGRDYSTVIHACKKIECLLEKDTELKSIIQDLEKEIAPLQC